MKILRKSKLGNFYDVPAVGSVVIIGVLVGFFSMNIGIEERPLTDSQVLGVSSFSFSTRSSGVQRIMDVCVDRAESGKWFTNFFADTVYKLESENVGYVLSIWIVNTGLASSLHSSLGALVGFSGYQHVHRLRNNIDRKRKVSHMQAQSQYEKDITACSEMAFQHDRGR